MVPGLFKLPPQLPEVALKQVTQTQTARLAGGLTVTFESSETDLESGETTFMGDVTALYGETLLRTRNLVVNERTKKGRASSGVKLTDPEGHVTADVVEFDWDKKSGHAERVVIQADNAHVESRSLDIVEGVWNLTDATGTLTRTGDAPVKFEAKSVTIQPGKGGVARKVYVRVFGKRIGPIASLSFNLNKRVKGLGLPSITNRKGKGVGVSWDSAFAIGDHGALSGFWESFPKREPSFGVQYSFSPLSPDASSLISPQSDLDERMVDGWFDNISTRNPDEETESLRAERRSMSVGSLWNLGTTARPTDGENISKRFEMVFEQGGAHKEFGYLTDVRIQSLRGRASSPFVERLVAEGTLSPKRLQVADRVWTHTRADVFATASKNGTFAWGRAEVGLIYRPNKSMALGLAYGVGSGTGRPDFEFDGLIRPRSVLARADFQFGPYTAHYLAKYDTANHVWYDREYELALVMRQFEPFVSYRQFPSETRIGVRFRLDNLRDRLTRKKQNR